MAVTEKEVTRTQATAWESPPEYQHPSDYQPWQEPPPGPNQPERDDSTTAARYRRARERVEELRGFYIHAFMYVLVNLALVGINLITLPGYLWCLWAILGWGVGLASHAFVVFGVGRFLGKEWEDRKIQEIIARDERS